MALEKGLPAKHKPSDHKQRSNIRYCTNFTCEQFYEIYQGLVDNDEVVSCDYLCGASVNPSTLNEWKSSAIHWQHHSVMSGCSHGS